MSNGKEYCMYLKKIRLRNIKCFKELELDFSEDILKHDLNKPESGVQRWTTLFGKNALGKSTLLQAMGAVPSEHRPHRLKERVGQEHVVAGDGGGARWAERNAGAVASG